MDNGSPIAQGPHRAESGEERGRLLSMVSWFVALTLVTFAIYLAWKLLANRQTGLAVLQPSPAADDLARLAVDWPPPVQVELPRPAITATTYGLERIIDLHTIIPSRPRQDVITYTVKTGDSIFEIAARYQIKPETLLWGNYAQLNDNPDMISVDMKLLIPPLDGVLYEWKPQDTLAAVAQRFEASPQDVLTWPGNDLDLTNPQIDPGKLLMIPGGRREFRQWLIPTIPRGSAGVASSVYGGGACEGGYEGAYGSGTFIWPAGNHLLSGNDFWPGHLAIDIAAGDGAPIYAADSGVVVFAGWATGGYGNTVMIDHGNGYQTLYAHMNSVTVRCGSSVSQGGTVGIAGSTGNSTGTHLHFEVRYQGGFINPWYVLPAP